MKAAVCLFGLCKYFKDISYPSIIKHVINPIKDKYDIDIFFHTYDVEKFVNPRNNEFNCKIDCNELFISNPKAYIITNTEDCDKLFDIEEFLKYDDEKKSHRLTITYILRQLNSLKQVWKCMDDYKNINNINYDLVIFARPDTKFISDIDIQDKIIDDKHIYTPGFQKYEGLNDRFVFSSYNSVKLWANRLDDIYNYYNVRGKKIISSEEFVKYIIKKYHIINIHSNCKMQRIREGGKICPSDYKI